ncbi:hypothetical protein [Alkalihalobacillus sp. 1P02AB]|uniref:hypothetical protein n=1 Tax=Alkalihalobacillus sp. 1P02AB TaxID=3132260 RepID=UPI0039A6D8B6
MKRHILSILILGVIFGLVGCTNPQSPQVQSTGAEEKTVTVQDITHTLFGPGPMKYSRMNKQAPYGQIGLSYQSSTQSQRTLGDDKEEIIEIIENHTEFTPGLAFIVGSHVYVHVDIPQSLNGDEKDKQIKELKSALRRQMPRYQYHVNEKDT